LGDWHGVRLRLLTEHRRRRCAFVARGALGIAAGEFLLDRRIRGEALAVAAATVAPSAAASAPPAAAVALTMRLDRPFEAGCVGGFARLLRWLKVVLTRRGSEVCGLLLR
jgi:hypothetical protein